MTVAIFRSTGDVATAINKSEEQARLILQDLAERGYAIEVEPGEWRATDLALAAFGHGLSSRQVVDA